MGFKSRVERFFVTLVVFAYLFGQSFHVTEGFKQSLKMYFDNSTEGDFLDFETNHLNLAEYSALLPKVKLVCAVGWWTPFSATNYLGTSTQWGSLTSQPRCQRYAGGTNSFRYSGMRETTSDGLSLYEVDYYRGTEILVEGLADAGITTPVKSIGATGNFQWKLFEGQHLEGKSVCITVPKPGYDVYFALDVQLYLNLTTIGSVFKGCNILEIEEYKRQNNI